jgi:cellulose synthase/poly-beta-1,6-N-acetylglucosamine synthase-like glycosyltransferase
MAGSDARERTALVITVLNEAESIDALLETIAQQTWLPDEVAVVDGGSSDCTLARLEAWQGRLPLRVLQAPGSTIARGRNVAIEATTADLIAVTDAGVRLAPDWLANLQACLSASVDVVSGFFVPDVHTSFERAMAATVLPDLEDVQPERFLPSSRSVLFRRSAWDAVGGYPEWLDYCEDLVFDLDLKRGGYRFAFAPDAVVWFRPRDSLLAFFKQYFRYARGDGKAGLWLGRHAIRYGVYALAFLLAPRGPLAWLLLVAGGFAYTRRPYQRLAPLLRDLPAHEQARAALLVPVIRLVGDVAKMFGFPTGIAWAWRRWTCRSSS